MLATIGGVDYFTVKKLGDLGNPITFYDQATIDSFLDSIASYAWKIADLPKSIMYYADIRNNKVGAYDTTISKNLESAQMADFAIIDIDHQYNFERGQSIILRNINTFEPEFWGNIDYIEMSYIARLTTHKISCTGYNYITDKRKVKKVFQNVLIENIVRWIYETYLRPEGIKVGRIATTGAMLADQAFDLCTVSEALKTLADLAGYIYRIDDAQRFFFEPFGGLVAPWDITDATLMNGLEGVLLDGLSLKKGDANYRNTIFLRGGKGTTEEITEEFAGDGTKTSFNLKYPINSITAVYVDNVEKTAGEQDYGSDQDRLYFDTGDTEFTPGKVLTGSSSGANGIVSAVVVESGSWAGGDAAGFIKLIQRNGIKFTGEIITDSAGGHATGVAEAKYKYDWYYKKGSAGISQGSNGTKMDASGVLTVTYTGLYDLLAVVSDQEAITDLAELEGGTGRVDSVVDAPEFTDMSSLIDYGRALLDQYAQDSLTVTFKTLSPGFQEGQKINISIPRLAVNDDFIVSTVEIETSDAVETYSITATNGVPETIWQEVFGRRPVAKSTDTTSIVIQQDLTKNWYEIDPLNPFIDDPLEMYQYIEIDAPYGGYRVGVADIDIAASVIIISAIVPAGEGIGNIRTVSLWGGPGADSVVGTGVKYYEAPALVEKSDKEILQFTFVMQKARAWTAVSALVEGWTSIDQGWLTYRNRSEGWI